MGSPRIDDSLTLVFGGLLIMIPDRCVGYFRKVVETL